MNYWNAFWVGGTICAVCQIFIDRTKLTPARILVALVVTGVFLEAVGIYQPVVDFAGAGATVPLLGFGYSLAKGVAKAVAESGLLGVFTGGVTGAAGGRSCVFSRKKYEKSPHRYDADFSFILYFRPNFLLKRSTRPPVSTSFCLPV